MYTTWSSTFIAKFLLTKEGNLLEWFLNMIWCTTEPTSWMKNDFVFHP
jgi:hypothetical protein